MDKDRLSLQAIFSGALEIQDPAARAVFLDSACAEDKELRDRVERLLRADARAGTFLQDRAEEGSDSPG